MTSMSWRAREAALDALASAENDRLATIEAAKAAEVARADAAAAREVERRRARDAAVAAADGQANAVLAQCSLLADLLSEMHVMLGQVREEHRRFQELEAIARQLGGEPGVTVGEPLRVAAVELVKERGNGAALEIFEAVRTVGVFAV
jgi:hypothetical protein